MDMGESEAVELNAQVDRGWLHPKILLIDSDGHSAQLLRDKLSLQFAGALIFTAMCAYGDKRAEGPQPDIDVIVARLSVTGCSELQNS